MTRTQRFLFFSLLFVFCAIPASAQVPIGTPRFGSFGGGPDVINLANLNSHITVPVLHKPGRGTNFTYDLSYDSSVWYPVGSSGSQLWTPVANWGWRGQTEVATGYVSASSHPTTCPNPDYPPTLPKTFRSIYRDTYVYHDTFGSPHPFDITVQSAICGGGGEYGVATDGSGYAISFDISGDGNFWITSSSGTAIIPSQFGSASKTDRNGNVISVNGSGQFFDTLSSTVPVLTAAGLGTAASPTTLTYAAPSGANAAYTINYTNYTVATNFGLSGITEYKSTAAVPLVSSIALPDGSQYTFHYEPTPSLPAAGACTPYAATTCVTARLTSVTLPTGGTISYAYSGGNNGILPDGSTATLTRTTPDGTWTYAQVKGTSAATTTTITAPQLPYDPAPNQTVIQFQGIYETQRKAYQGSTSGTLLRNWNTCHNAATSPCTSTAITLPITQRTVIDQYGSAGLQCKHNYLYNGVGGLTEQDDYDYGSGAPGALLKKTLVTFASLGNITAFRQTVTVQNDAGATIAQTSYNFDEVTPTATSGVSQHASVTGSRGNLTSINYPISGMNAHFTYYDTGSINTQQDVNSATTTYNYSSNAASCQTAFPTSISEPLSLSQSITWNCTGGVITQLTDDNGQSASAAYTDTHFWRPASATDQVSATTNLTYPGQNAFESALTFNSGNSTSEQLTTLDNLGRAHVQQVKQSPAATNYDSVEADYDALGRPSRSTLPYSGTAGQTTSPTAPGVTTSYDALSRPLVVTDTGGGTSAYSYSNNDVLITAGPTPTGENAKRRQLEYDSLGRSTSVCEITSGSTAWPSGSCGQQTAQTGYWTKYSYDALGNLLTVTQNAQATSNQQTRTYTYDAMSRLTSEKNPEMNQVATTYTYDLDATCTPAAKGDLVKRIDPVGNTSCYSYDALHRLTSVVYSGPYATNTPNKYFVYDTGSVNSIAMQNGKTRVIEAYTATTQTGTRITDLGFGYSVRGEVSDVYQSTPHSSGYYHFNQTYWAHGAPNQLSQLVGLPAITYGASTGAGLDGEGRITQVTAGTGQNPVTGVTFNTSSLPTQVNLGSGDNDIFAYDPNTLRMTQFKFNVGASSQSLTGNLTWNANSSLGQLGITDQLNSADTQTCNYNHDDMVRIATANCGTAASQTFSYDPFGNVNKSGSPNSFQPTYSAATNRMTSLPGSFTPTYDANGNVLNDSNHTYAWDADNNSVTVDALGLTFDALDRMVEQNRSGTYTQIVYAPTGAKLALMNAQSLVKAFVPLPGQATAVYTSAGLDHYRHSDWLGSARLTSSPSRAFVSSLAYAPFGETYAQSGATDFSFTGQNQDTSSGDYDFLFREYSTQGRWVSPDPAALAAVDPASPQSWNRYSYVLNDPLDFLDPLGLCGGPPGDVSATVGGVSIGSVISISAACPDMGLGGGGLWMRAPFLDTPSPTMRGVRKNCSLSARIFKATDFSFKEGLDVEAGVFNVGLSRNVNFETNATTVQAELGLFGSGFNAQRVTDPGYLNPDLVNPNTEFSGHLGPIEHVFGGETKFSTSKLIKLGFAVGGGLDFSFDINKFKELTASCKEP